MEVTKLPDEGEGLWGCASGSNEAWSPDHGGREGEGLGGVIRGVMAVTKLDHVIRGR